MICRPDSLSGSWPGGPNIVFQKEDKFGVGPAEGMTFLHGDKVNFGGLTFHLKKAPPLLELALLNFLNHFKAIKGPFELGPLKSPLVLTGEVTAYFEGAAAHFKRLSSLKEAIDGLSWSDRGCGDDDE